MLLLMWMLVDWLLLLWLWLMTMVNSCGSAALLQSGACGGKLWLRGLWWWWWRGQRWLREVCIEDWIP